MSAYQPISSASSYSPWSPAGPLFSLLPSGTEDPRKRDEYPSCPLPTHTHTHTQTHTRTHTKTYIFLARPIILKHMDSLHLIRLPCGKHFSSYQTFFFQFINSLFNCGHSTLFHFHDCTFHWQKFYLMFCTFTPFTVSWPLLIFFLVLEFVFGSKSPSCSRCKPSPS